MMLEIRNLTFSYEKDMPVLSDISFSAGQGELISVLGPNGVGKSTLFKCILGMLSSYEGEILLDGKEIRSLSPKKMAAYIAYIPQIHRPTFGYRVIDVVLMGANRHVSQFGMPREAHVKGAMEALRKAGIEALAERDYARLSGGEQQLVLIARAIAQDSRILIMDEPTSSLDYGNQHRILTQIRALAGDGYTVILSTHDPQHALHFADRVLALADSRVAADGKPEDVMTPALIRTLYGMDTELLETKCGRVILPKLNRESRREFACEPVCGMFQWKPEMIRFMADASEYTGYPEKIAGMMAEYLQPSDRVLEPGCGMGHLTMAVAGVVKSVTAVDVNENVIEVLQGECGRRGITNIHAICGDVFEMDLHCADQDDSPGSDGDYDVLISSMFCHAEQAVGLARKYGIRRIILLVSAETTHQFSAGGEEKKNHLESDLAYLKEKQKQGLISYKVLDACGEFGQPFRSLEDAERFMEIYNRDSERKITGEDVKRRIVETDNPEFPYYLPKKRKRKLIIIETEEIKT